MKKKPLTLESFVAIVPWDIDLDAQVTLGTLHYMARYLNGSTHAYRSLDTDGNVGQEVDDDGGDKVMRGRRKRHQQQERRPQRYDYDGQSHNGTGLYLLDVNPHFTAPYGNGKNQIDARWIDTATGLFVDITGLAPRRYENDYDPRGGLVWSCKGGHRYWTREGEMTFFVPIPGLSPKLSDG